MTVFLNIFDLFLNSCLFIGAQAAFAYEPINEYEQLSGEKYKGICALFHG